MCSKMRHVYVTSIGMSIQATYTELITCGEKDCAVCTTFYQHIAEVQLNFGCSYNRKVMPGFVARPYT